jgi:exopolyphosphatase
MISIQSYLCSIKSRLADCRFVVIGNEAADLDSMVSSIAYGYLLTQQDSRRPALPVVCIPRADFILRREAVYLFQEAEIKLEDVIFLDEVKLDEILVNSRLILVDHNRLSENLKQYSDRVVAIIDHHKDEGFYPAAEPRIIQTIGSTATLIAKEFRKCNVDVGRDMAILFAGTILLDTVNLDPAAHKATAADREVVAEMLPSCPMSRQDLFEKTQLEKCNVHGLSTRDLLRKDYKEYQFGKSKCGIAVVALGVSKWSEMDRDLASAFEEFVEYRKLDLLLVMNVSNNRDFQRELIIFCKKEGRQERLLSYLQENGLELTQLPCSDQKQIRNGVMRIYSQANVRISRKRLQPLLAAFFV